MASATDPTTTRGNIDITSLLASLRRGLPALLVVAALAGAIAFVLVNSVPPLYRGETQLAVGVGAGNPGVLAQTLAGEVQLIRSRDIASEVVASLSLGERPEFQSSSGVAATFRDILVTLGLARDLRALSPEERVLALYDDHLTVEAGRRSPVVRIGFWSTDPVFAAEAANAVAGAYVALRQSAADESAALETQIATLQASVADGQRRASELRADLDGMPVLDAAERASLLA